MQVKPRGVSLTIAGQLDYDVQAQALVAIGFPRGRIILFVMGFSVALDWNTEYSGDRPGRTGPPRTS